jgi:hypothetical protein
MIRMTFFIAYYIVGPSYWNWQVRKENLANTVNLEFPKISYYRKSMSSNKKVEEEKIDDDIFLSSAKKSEEERVCPICF